MRQHGSETDRRPSEVVSTALEETFCYFQDLGTDKCAILTGTHGMKGLFARVIM